MTIKLAPAWCLAHLPFHFHSYLTVAGRELVVCSSTGCAGLHLCEYTHVCIAVNSQVCASLQIHAGVSRWIHMCVHPREYMQVCPYKYMCPHVLHTCAHLWIHTCVLVSTHRWCPHLWIHSSASPWEHTRLLTNFWLQVSSSFHSCFVWPGSLTPDGFPPFDHPCGCIMVSSTPDIPAEL